MCTEKQNSYMHTAICTCDPPTSCHGSNDEVDLDLMIRAKGATLIKKKKQKMSFPCQDIAIKKMPLCLKG